jgi:hypothetical protein
LFFRKNLLIFVKHSNQLFMKIPFLVVRSGASALLSFSESGKGYTQVITIFKTRKVMKKTFLLSATLLVCLCLTLLPANAQCYDCMKRERGDDWRFAAGITLYSNNPYQAYLDLPRQPLEFNFRYKIGDHHVLRMGLPIVVNLNLGEGGWVLSPYRYDGKKSLKEYYTQVKKEMDFQQYFHTLKNRYSLYGIALGYDYNHSIIPAFSVFGGAELAYTMLYTNLIIVRLIIAWKLVIICTPAK